MILSAFDPLGRVKLITQDDVDESALVLEGLLKKLDDGPTDPYTTASAVWIELTARLARAGTPAQMLVDTATRVVHQASCVGNG